MVAVLEAFVEDTRWVEAVERVFIFRLKIHDMGVRHYVYGPAPKRCPKGEYKRRFGKYAGRCTSSKKRANRVPCDDMTYRGWASSKRCKLKYRLKRAQNTLD